MTQIKVVQFGFGPIGIQSVRPVLCQPGLKLVGAVEIDPGRAGNDLGELFEHPQHRRIVFCDQSEKVIFTSEPKPEVVLLI